MAKPVKVQKVQATLSGIRLPMGLLVDHLAIHGSSLSIDTHPPGYRLEEPGTVEAVISQESLAEFLTNEAPGGLKDFQVRAEGGKLHVQATAVMILPIKASAICTLRIANESQLHVDLESVDVMGMGGRSMVESQLAKINPVFDASDLPIPMKLDRVEIAKGMVTLFGRITPSA